MSAETYPAINDDPPLLKRRYHVYLHDPRGNVAEINFGGVATLWDHTWILGIAKKGQRILSYNEEE